MILEVEKDVQKAEATIHVSGADLFAKAQSDDMYTSIDQLPFPSVGWLLTGERFLPNANWQIV
jgi:hypothetical protein